MGEPGKILWPACYESKCPVDVENELEMPSEQQNVWAWLIRAQLWPSWYPNSANMRFISGQPPDLALSTQFKWKTGFLNPETMRHTAFSFSVNCKVMEFLPPERLAYEFKATGIRGYQAWLIEKQESGCHVQTEERQRGFLARLGKSLGISDKMVGQHQIWLETLKKKAADGPPF